MCLSTAIHSDGDLSYDEIDHLQMKQVVLFTDLIFQKRNCVLTLQRSEDCTYCNFVCSP